MRCILLIRKGGHAATTDANLVLGRILPEFFPKIFGKSEDQPLDADAAAAALDELAKQVNAEADAAGRKHMSRDEVSGVCLRPWTCGLPWHAERSTIHAGGSSARRPGKPGLS